MATERSGPPRIPLIASFEARGLVPSDTRLVNGYVEKTHTGEVVVKRPAFSLYQAAGVVGKGRGVFHLGGQMITIVDDKVLLNGALFSTLTSSHGFGTGMVSAVDFHTDDAHNWFVFHDEGAMFVMLNLGPLGPALPFGLFNGGIAYLDGTVYASFGSFQNTDIRGSDFNDPNTWNPLNVIKALENPDGIVYICKYYQYIVCFKEFSVEFFWDAANPVGSPLSPVTGSGLPFGCFHQDSVQLFEDVIIWLSTSNKGGLSIMMMTGLQPQTISTPAIERMLMANFPVPGIVYSWTARVGGHRFYCITLAKSISLVYDLTAQRWYQWTYNGSYLPFIASTKNNLGADTLLQHENGSLYKLSMTAGLDDGLEIPVDIYTPTWDGGTRKRKTLQRLEVIGDQAGMHRADLRWSDDDYQTWSNFRKVDLGKKRAFTDDLGTFHKRAFHLRYNAPTPFRISALEATNILLGAE